MSAAKKIILGQFFTKEAFWLKPQIIQFIKESNCKTAYDPFAGAGHLLTTAENLGLKTVGLDIDNTLGWKQNDSLQSIPHLSDDTIIITNPPYLTNYSASRKGILDNVKQYFQISAYCDLYLIALEKMMQAQNYVVAIIPETFINSNFKHKDFLHSITILEENLFDDTDTPVVVACFDCKPKKLSKVKIYKNDKFINDLATIEKLRLIPTKDVEMKFNDENGWLAVRCVDTTNPNVTLKFDFKKNIAYNWDKGIKDSSRLLTLISIDIPQSQKTEFVKQCNQVLNKLRHDTGDIILSPFKGNMKSGTRRRRLDFKTCRAIIEIVYKSMNKGAKNEQ